MCVARAYLKQEGHKEILLEEVALIKSGREELYLKTLFGEEKSLRAKIVKIDFANSTVLLASEVPKAKEKRE